MLVPQEQLQTMPVKRDPNATPKKEILKNHVSVQQKNPLIDPEVNFYAHKLLEMEERLVKIEKYLRRSEENQTRIMEENRILRHEVIKVRKTISQNFQKFSFFCLIYF